MSKQRAKMHGGVCFIYVFGLCFFIGGVIWSIFEQSPDGATIGMIFVVGTLVLVIQCINYQIEFDEVGFHYRNIFRITRYFKWSDLDSFVIGAQTYFIFYSGKHSIRLYQYTINADTFTKQLTTSRALLGLPELKDRDTMVVNGKEPLFHGHIIGAHSLLSVFTIMSIIAVACGLLFSMTFIQHRPFYESQLETRILIFHHTEPQKYYMDLYFRDQEEPLCLIDIYDNYNAVDWTSFEKYAYRGIKLTLLVEKGEKKPWIRAMWDENRSYLTLEDANAAYLKNALFSLYLGSFCILLGVFYVLGFLIAANNPAKHMKLIKLYVPPNRIRYDVTRTR